MQMIIRHFPFSSSLLSAVVGWNHLIKLIECKFFVGLSSLLDKHAVHQVQKRLVVHVLSDWSGNFLQLVESDHASVFLIVKPPDSLKTISCLVLSNLVANNIDEFLKVEDFVGLSQSPDNFDNVLISLVKTDLFQDLNNFLRVDGAASVLVENEEDISEMFVIFRVDSVSPGGRNLLFSFGVRSVKFVWRFGAWWWHCSFTSSHLIYDDIFINW